MSELNIYEKIEFSELFRKLSKDMKLYAIINLLPPDILISMGLGTDDGDLLAAINEKLKIEKESEVLKEKYAHLAEKTTEIWHPIYAVMVEIAPIEVVVDIAFEKRKVDVINKILERLKKEIDTETLKKHYPKLTKSKNLKIRKFAASYAPIELIVEMALIEEDTDVITTIVKRLEKEVDTDIVKQNYINFSKSTTWEIRKFAASYVPIELIVEMALIEENTDVITTIVEILEREIDTDLIKENLVKFSKSSSYQIRVFATSYVPIEIVLEMALTEDDEAVIDILLKRLKEQIDTDLLKKSYFKLSKAKSWKLRKFIAEHVSIEKVLKMALTEDDEAVIDILLKRLDKEIDTDLVKQSYSKLSKAKSYKIRKFVAKHAPIELIVEMALYEEYGYVIDMILKNQIDETMIKGNFSKLSEAKSWELRRFVAENAPIEIVLEMALTEEYYQVTTSILTRLEKEIDTDLVKQSYSKLSKAKSYKIRKIVAENAPIELIVEMALYEEHSYVIDIILKILKNQRDEAIVKENFIKLSKAKSYKIRKFVARYASIEILIKNLLINKYLNEVFRMEEYLISEEYITTIICQRLEEHVDTEIVRENYLKLSKSSSCEIREFVAENAPIEVIVKMTLIEKYSDILHKLYFRLERESEAEIIKQNYAKLAKVNSAYIKIFVMKHAPSEIIEELLLTKEDKEILDKLKKFI